jgi:hypothetical protein
LISVKLLLRIMDHGHQGERGREAFLESLRVGDIKCSTESDEPQGLGALLFRITEPGKGGL